MPILFCNIAWMKRYRGRDPKDPPKGGGAFIGSDGWGGEELNFVPCEDGYVYGYFETNTKDVLIERLGAATHDEYIDEVDVVWTAPVKGHEPHVIVGWYKGARLYRKQQLFNGNYPSAQHQKDKTIGYRVRAKIEDAVILQLSKRTMELGSGRGWRGRANWWYAEESKDAAAQLFVHSTKQLIDGRSIPAVQAKRRSRHSRAGAATAKTYRKYLREHEINVSPRHHRLQNRFERYLLAQDPALTILAPYRDDLRYRHGNGDEIMAEIKPTEPGAVRYAIRTAIGQLLDYRQHQRWAGRQLIVVESDVHNAEDRALAHDHGFGLAWPSGSSFRIVWP